MSMVVESIVTRSSTPSGDHLPLRTASKETGMERWNGISVLRPSTRIPSNSDPRIISPSLPSETLWAIVMVASDTLSASASGGRSSEKTVLWMSSSVILSSVLVVQDDGSAVLGSFSPGPGFPMPISMILWNMFPNVAGSTESTGFVVPASPLLANIESGSTPALTSSQWHLGHSKYPGSLLGFTRTLVEDSVRGGEGSGGSVVWFPREAWSIDSILWIGVMMALPSSFVSGKQSGWWIMVMPVLPVPPRNASSSRLPGSMVLLPPFARTGFESASDESSQGDSVSPLLHDPIRNDSSHICPSWGAVLS